MLFCNRSHSHRICPSFYTCFNQSKTEFLFTKISLLQICISAFTMKIYRACNNKTIVPLQKTLYFMINYPQ